MKQKFKNQQEGLWLPPQSWRYSLFLIFSVSFLQNLVELAVGLFLHCLFLCWGFGDLITVLIIPSMLLCFHVSFIIFHQAGSCSLSATVQVEASSPHRCLTNLQGCITVLARRHCPGMGTESKQSGHMKGLRESHQRCSSALPHGFTWPNGSECNINYDRLEVPPARRPQCLWASQWLFWKGKRSGLCCSLLKAAPWKI